MPRQSEAALSLAHIGPVSRRLEPPAELGEIEAATFRQTVASMPLEHFAPEDVSLLVAYSQAAVLAQKAAAELAAHPVVDGRVSPWLTIQKEQVRLLAQLSVRLKIGPKSRRPDSRRAGRPMAAPDAYEVLGLSSGQTTPWGDR
jgi:hypothetical protein